MNEQNIHNEQLDAFSHGVKHHIENHQLSVDDTVWANIAQELSAGKKKRFAAAIWWGVAAAVLIGVILLFNPNKKSSQELPQLAKNEQENTYQNEETSEKKYFDNEYQAISKQQNISSNSNKGMTQPRHNPQNINVNNGFNRNSHDELLVTATPNITQNTQFLNTSKPTIKDTISLIKTKENKGTKASEKQRINHHNQIEKKQKIGLFAGLGSSSPFEIPSTLDESYIENSPPNDDEDLTTGKENHDDNKDLIMSSENFSHLAYSNPISFSVMAEIPLDSVWSIETGIMYTYLSTSFETIDNKKVKGNLRLHYIGVPLHVKANIWHNKRWNMYVSVGGAVEKGLRATLTHHITGTTAQMSKTTHSGIDGLQFSATAAAGLDYKLNDHIRLFGEPKFSYYFDNNQPISIRTDNPYTLGLNAGFRIQF